MDTRESYQVISINLKKILTSLKKNAFSLLDIYANNNYLLADFISAQKDKVKEIVTVGSAKAEFDGASQQLSITEWESDTLNIAKKLKNAVVIFNQIRLDTKKFTNLLEEMAKFFPIIFIISGTRLTELENWKIKPLASNVTILLNKDVKNFTSFRIDNFENVKSISISSYESRDYSYTRGEEEVAITLEPTISPPVTRKRPNAMNLSIFDNLPSPSVKPDPSSKVFMQEFYTYLHTLISRILPSGKEALLPYLLNRKTLKDTWLSAFTHELVSPERSENYETLETIGDKVQDYALYIYAVERFPYASDEDLSNIKQQVLKTENQQIIGQAMKLTSWAIMPDQLRSNQKISEDLWEAFTGAIDTILNQKSSSLAQSTNIIYHLFKIIFADYDFSEELKGPAKNFVMQLIEQIEESKPATLKTFKLSKPAGISAELFDEILACGNSILKREGITTPLSIHGSKKNTGIDEVTEKIEEPEFSKINTKVILNKYGSDILARRGIRIKEGTILGEATEATKRPSETIAYTRARDFLAKKGVTPDWRDNVKMKRVTEKLENLDIALAKAKNINANINKVTVASGKAIKKDQFYQVIGLDKNNKKYILDIFVSDDKARDNFQLAIDNFVKK